MKAVAACAIVEQVLTLLIASSLVASPIWARLAARFGDVTTYRLAALMYAIGFALYF